MFLIIVASGDVHLDNIARRTQRSGLQLGGSLLPAIRYTRSWGCYQPAQNVAPDSPNNLMLY